MKYVYIDNFRGFQDTLISLRDVNFLVGENSTGKTTILHIVNLLSSFSFWHDQDFNSDAYKVGYFNDVVTKNSRQNKHFTIGLADTEEEGAPPYLINMRFGNINGRPVIDRLKFVTEKSTTLYKATAREARRKDLPGSRGIDQKDIRDHFSQWGEDFDEKFRKDYKRLRFQGNPPHSNLGELLFWLKDGPRAAFFLQRRIIEKTVWIAPVRGKPERIYDLEERFSPEGKHMPYQIREIIQNKDDKDFENYISKFGSESGLFSRIEIESYGDSDDLTSPFSLSVELQGSQFRLNNVGYGVSQSLPVIVEMFDRPPETRFAIQQPEVHLHPRARAALGDLFFQLADREDKSFLIETHSDFTIDRFRYHISQNKSEVDSQIIFFEKEDGFNTVEHLPIGSNGTLPDDQPDSYRKFFIAENLRTISI